MLKCKEKTYIQVTLPKSLFNIHFIGHAGLKSFLHLVCNNSHANEMVLPVGRFGFCSRDTLGSKVAHVDSLSHHMGRRARS
jgi:hypothetical protein